MSNLLVNPDFEVLAPVLEHGEKIRNRVYVYPVTKAPYVTVRGENMNPKGWRVWYRHHEQKPAHVPWDENNKIGFSAPEVRLTEPIYEDRRVNGERALQMFTFYRIHDGGVFQVVEDVTPGDTLRFSIMAHGWVASGDMSPKESLPGHGGLSWEEGTLGLNGDQKSIMYRVGIDPTGGTDPLSDSVIWGEGKHIFNEFDGVSVEVVAQSSTVTVFFRSQALWPVMHVDTYVDAASLTVVEDSGDAAPPEEMPKEEYEFPGLPDAEGRSKLGPHVLVREPDLDPWLRQGRPTVVKFVGSWGSTQGISDDILVIGRRVEDGWPIAQGDPIESARRFVDHQEELYTHKDNRRITHWEGPNEPAAHKEALEWYAQFEIERMSLLWQRYGLRSVIANFSTGTPELEDWPAFFPALEAALEYDAVLGLHEYGGGYMSWMFGANQLDPTEDEGDTGWTTGRYRKVYRKHLIPNGLVVPLVITECGIDPGVHPHPPNAPKAHWRDLADYWLEKFGAENVYEEYVRQLLWYEKELRRDPYVIGATLYTHGSTSEKWDGFDVSGTPVVNMLKDYQPKPKSHEEDGKDWQTVVHVPGEGVTLERAGAILRSTFKDARSIVFSHNDTARLASDEKDEIHLWDVPADRRPSLEAWYAERTPAKLVYEPKAQKWGLPLGGPNRHPSIWYVANYHGPDGDYDSGFHTGWDVNLDKRPWGWVDLGEEVYAMSDGIVHSVGYNGAWLGVVVIEHQYKGRPLYVRYAHLAERKDELPGVGERVHVGQMIGTLGNYSKGSHLHTDMSRLPFEWYAWCSPSPDRWLDPDPIYKDLFGDSTTAVFKGRGDTVKQKPERQYDGTLIGLHDEIGPNGTGADWLANQGVRSAYIVRPVYADTTLDRLDFQRYADLGFTVHVTLRYSWDVENGGSGTLPGPNSGKAFWYIDRAIEQIEAMRGVQMVSIANEYNNPREHPIGDPLHPDYVREIYRQVRAGVSKDIMLAPGAIDPYNAEVGTPIGWQRGLFNSIEADFICVHGYIRGPRPSLIGSQAKFGDPPLLEQFLNYPGCFLTLLDDLPPRYQDLPVYVEEFNHIHDGDPQHQKWVHQAVVIDIIRRAFDVAVEHKISGIAMYRWAKDKWAVHDNPYVKDAIKDAIKELAL